jgi:hypothetical protein
MFLKDRDLSYRAGIRRVWGWAQVVRIPLFYNVVVGIAIHAIWNVNASSTA